MKNTLVAALGATLVVLSATAVAQTDSARQERMDAAYRDHASGQPSAGSRVGEDAREAGHAVADGARATGHAVRDGTKATGHAIHRGVKATGHAIHQGVKATGHAIHEGVDKVTGK